MSSSTPTHPTQLHRRIQKAILTIVIVGVLYGLGQFMLKNGVAAPALAQCTGTHSIVTIANGTNSSSSAFSIDLDIGSDGLPFIAYFIGNSVRSAKCGNFACNPTSNITYATPGSGQPNSAPATPNYGLMTVLRPNPLITHFSNSGGNQEKFVSCNNSACTSYSAVFDGADQRKYVGMTLTPGGKPVVLNGVDQPWNQDAISGRQCANTSCNPVNQLDFGTFLKSNGSYFKFAYRPIPIMSGSNPLQIAYNDYSNGNLVMYRCTDGSCGNGTSQTIDNGLSNSYTPAVLKSNGNPVVAYNKGGTIKVLICGNSNCTSGNSVRTIDSNTANLTRVSLAVGTDNVPVVAYFRGGSTADLYVARCNDANCSGAATIQRVATGASSQDVVIGLGSGNKPGIAYRENGGSLKYVSCIDAVCSPDVSGCATPTPSPSPTPSYGPGSRPSNIQVREDDGNGGTTIQTYNMYFSWTPPTDSSFASGANRYHVYISDSASFTTNVIDVIRAKTVPWYSTLGDSAAIAKVRPNKQYYVRVCADYDDGAGGWNQQCATTVPFSKIAYSPATFSGSTNQRIVSASAPAACTSGVPNRFMGTIAMTPNTNGYSSSCSTTSGGGSITNYTCTITLDNVNYNPSPNQSYSLTMSGGSSIYGCGGSCSAIGSCSNVFTPNLDANQTKVTSGSQPLYVNTDLAASFFKVKNMSVYTSAGINSPFPAGHQPFNSNDIGDNYFNQGSSGTNVGVGVVMSNGTQTAGLSSAPNSGISAPGWRSSSYSSATTKYVGSSFISFARGAKQIQTISSLSDSAFTSASSGIFLVSGDLTLNSSNISSLNGKYVIVMSEGTIRISNDVNLASGTVALFANTIYVDSAVGVVKGILSANTIYVTTSASAVSTTPLSVLGTLSAKNPIDMTKRARTDNDLQPSIFIQADPGAYLNLLPHLSVMKTEYQQAQ